MLELEKEISTEKIKKYFSENDIHSLLNRHNLPYEIADGYLRVWGYYPLLNDHKDFYFVFVFYDLGKFKNTSLQGITYRRMFILPDFFEVI